MFKFLLTRGYVRLLLKSIYDCAIEPKIRFLLQIIKRWPLNKGAKNIIKRMNNSLFISKDSPVFVFINLMEVHEPYSLINEKYSKKLYLDNLSINKSIQECAKQWRKRYPKAVRYASNKVMEIMKLLLERNMFDNSLIIVTSDHGQLLGEYGRIGHGTFLYDELLNIPLLIKYPKNMEIEFYDASSKYIGLINLKPFILHLLSDKNKANDGSLYSDTVFPSLSVYI